LSAQPKPEVELVQAVQQTIYCASGFSDIVPATKTQKSLRPVVSHSQHLHAGNCGLALEVENIER
jgi:hypothetical protein